MVPLVAIGGTEENGGRAPSTEVILEGLKLGKGTRNGSMSHFPGPYRLLIVLSFIVA